MEKQQTAVNWFIEKIGYQKEGQWYIGIREDVNIQDWIDQVRQMHKEQIENAWDRGKYIGETFPQRNIEPEYENNSEQYYNETYGQ